ncbi:MAG: glycosyltransferase family 39 protein [Candidatus Cloacimonetes bacterium]|nr:glycosyltransferase family 39 protein [Candidatus Cloacimonadota bacterium]
MKKSVLSIFDIFRDTTALLILGIGFVVRLIASIFVVPGIDEAYYGVCSYFPAWGFFDHPPIVVITAGFGRWLTDSYSPLSLRLGAIILFLISAILMYFIVRSLFERKAAIFSILFLHTIPYFFVGMGAFVIPDNALGVFWLLFILSIMKVNQTGKGIWFLLSGVSLGFAMLSKYHAILLLLSIGFCLIAFREWRRYWKSPFLYIGLLVAGLIFLPNVLWNAKHDWVSYTYQFGKGVGHHSISFTKFYQGVLVQAAYLLPWIMIILIISIVKTIDENDEHYRWLLPFALLPIGIFTLFGATQQILPHWPMPGYLAAIILTSGWMFSWKKPAVKWTFWSTGIVTTVLLIIIVIHSITGFLNLGVKMDLTLEGFGWDKVIDDLEGRNLLDDETFLFTHKYITGGELGYAAQKRYPVAVFDVGSAHHFAYWSPMDSLMGKDGIFVMHPRYTTSPEARYSEYFEEIIPLTGVMIYRNGKYEMTYNLWLCKNLQKPYPLDYGP